MFSLMPVAAFAADPVVDMSIFTAKSGSATVRTGETVEFVWKVRDNQAQEVVNGELTNVYVWAVDANGNRTSALELWNDAEKTVKTSKNLNPVDNTYGAYSIPNNHTTYVSFARPGV